MEADDALLGAGLLVVLSVADAVGAPLLARGYRLGAAYRRTSTRTDTTMKTTIPI